MPFTLVITSLVCFSVFYFSYVFRIAVQRYFWHDELFTVYLCRLTTARRVLQAVRAGVDFNQPLFYILTRASNALFGEGLIATRLPGIVGFWLSCLSLFWFINHRYGPAAGLLAMAIPMTSNVFYYACEARPHGMVLGFAGLALVFWQLSTERPLPNHWLVGLSISLIAAFLTHCYALVIVVPFALGETFGIVSSRQVNWPIWIAIVAPTIIACLWFIPSIRAYRTLTSDTDLPSLFPARLSEVRRVYGSLFQPCIQVLLAAVSVFALSGSSRALAYPASAHVIWREVILAIGFLAVPILAVALGMVTGAPFFPRYCLSTIFGLAMVIGAGVGIRHIDGWFVLASTMVAIGHAVSSGVGTQTLYSGESPLTMHPLLTSNSAKGLPIVVVNSHEFLYLAHYAEDLVHRLFYVSRSDNDVNHRSFDRLQQWCPVRYNQPLTNGEFLRSNAQFLLYGTGPLLIERLSLFKASGYRVKSVAGNNDHLLVEIEIPN